MSQRRNRDIFDDVERSDDGRVYIQEIPSGVDEVAPRLDRAEPVVPVEAVTHDHEFEGLRAPAELADPVAPGLIGEADVEPSGALMEDVSTLLGDDDDGDTSCLCTHL